MSPKEIEELKQLFLDQNLIEWVITEYNGKPIGPFRLTAKDGVVELEKWNSPHTSLYYFKASPDALI